MQSDSDSESETGPYLQTPTDFNLKSLKVLADDSKTKLVLYNNSKNLFIKSDCHIGRVYLYERKNKSFSILIKTSEIMNIFRKGLEKRLKNAKVTFYTREPFTHIYCFFDNVINSSGESCVNCLYDGVPKLLPIANLKDLTCSLSAVLKSTTLKKSSKNEYQWGLRVRELIIDTSKTPIGNYADKPVIKYAQMD